MSGAWVNRLFGEYVNGDGAEVRGVFAGTMLVGSRQEYGDVVVVAGGVAFVAARRPASDSVFVPAGQILACDANAMADTHRPITSLVLLTADGAEYIFAPVAHPERAEELIRSAMETADANGSVVPYPQSPVRGNGPDVDDDASLALALALQNEGSPFGLRSPVRQTETRSQTRGVARAPTGFPKGLACYSSVVADMPGLEVADKIVLPASVLSELVELEVEARPYAFRLAKPDASGLFGKRTHAGVLSFTAPEGTMYLPYWMMANLEVDEGEELQLQLATLPKGRGVQLQPVEAEWLDVAAELREAVLLDQLSRLQCLTQGDAIMLRCGAQLFGFNVVATDPSPAISIVDTNLVTDVLAPINPPATPEPTLLPGKVMVGEVDAGEYAYFAFKVVHPHGFELEAVPAPGSSGDPDLYVSNVVRKPTRAHFTWSGVQVGAGKIRVTSEDPSFAIGTYTVGVTSLEAAAAFELKYTPLDAVAATAAAAAAADRGAGKAGPSGSGSCTDDAAGETDECPHAGGGCGELSL
ncbi:ubiquitin fusion degradation protein [Thecamonas trahens ATCC 50062]|uniref:Ubiquitin fusion degradation protein n=1 Tax=Thecamonas trahens ATCC 50062 TaxID=461836 RepID=A0A0L0D9Z2_THETB|nr:ubiquitin fusion degradation protein [Thecamonas trahens ATCC 50062]KNC48093.1 ubiquitin fusion degradation protein [Thecamonas trahens ATCC 50062]|eukprot:XP_013759106.1 ubiquitin fusion degradation protein [Thecamonas trahens ATCC 50062]